MDYTSKINYTIGSFSRRRFDEKNGKIIVKCEKCSNDHECYIILFREDTINICRLHPNANLIIEEIQ